jgi:hypothetical protein
MSSLAEAAKAVIGTFEARKIIYINFLTEIQPECDCMPAADVPIIQDLGIMISEDIVAIEQASIDLLLKSGPLEQSLADDRNLQKGDDILMRLHEKPYILQVEEAERLGLGSRLYEISEI